MTNLMREFTTTVKLDEHLACCEGHFPGYPVVPGAYLLSCISAAFSVQMPAYKMERIARVKFNRIVRPGSSLSLRFECKDDLKLSFTAYSESEEVLSGRASLALC